MTASSLTTLFAVSKTSQPPEMSTQGSEYRHHFSTFDRSSSPCDNYQTAMHHAQQHAASLQFGGGGHRGPIPFDSIPMTHIQLYVLGCHYMYERPLPRPDNISKLQLFMNSTLATGMQETPYCCSHLSIAQLVCSWVMNRRGRQYGVSCMTVAGALLVDCYYSIFRSACATTRILFSWHHARQCRQVHGYIQQSPHVKATRIWRRQTTKSKIKTSPHQGTKQEKEQVW